MSAIHLPEQIPAAPTITGWPSDPLCMPNFCACGWGEAKLAVECHDPWTAVCALGPHAREAQCASDG